MRIISKAVSCASFMLGAFGAVYCQGSQGIVPLHSKCEDVKLAIGVTECETKTYDLKHAMVSINFSDGTCLSGWKVPAGTVLTLDIHPKPPLKFAELNIEGARFKKVVGQHVQGVVYYKNGAEGISIAISAEGTVLSLFYGPSTKDESVRFPSESSDQDPSDAGAFGSVKFDEYGEIDAKEERKRLDEFAVQLRAEAKTQGYLIAYGGRRSWPGEAKHRAACAKSYLIKRQGINKQRIVTIDGGFREEAAIALYIRLENGNPPFAFPTVDPSEVKIINRGRGSYRGSSCRLQDRVRQKPN